MAAAVVEAGKPSPGVAVGVELYDLLGDVLVRGEAQEVLQVLDVLDRHS